MGWLAVADDLSGAAEIAGLAWRRGLEASVYLEPVRDDSTNKSVQDRVCVYDADSRLLSSVVAAECLRAFFMGRDRARTRYFLKTDSVLRGNPGAEIEAAMEAGGYRRALLVAGNPESGRWQRKGRLMLGDKLLEQSAFAEDPYHPARCSEIGEILRVSGARGAFRFLEAGDALPEQGVLAGRMASREDLAVWADRVDGETLPCGGGAFFGALLDRDRGGFVPRELPDGLQAKSVLFICGSAHGDSARAVAAAREAGVAVHYLEPGGAPDGGSGGGLAEEAVSALESGLMAKGRAVLAIRPLAEGAAPFEGSPDRLRQAMAMVTEELLCGSGTPELLCIEGGATGREILERLGCRRLDLEREWAQGVVTLRSAAGEALPLITLKPGSYAWPWPLAD